LLNHKLVRQQPLGRNRIIAPRAAHHPLDVAGERPNVVIATEKTQSPVHHWSNKAITRTALDLDQPASTITSSKYWARRFVNPTNKEEMQIRTHAVEATVN
jgi:hypothetical protein